ncbi:MAG: DUF488 domain-containing protein [Candidatus Accumulibacter sp.]|jgi:uncharacterized protein (DUF488 family)|nr:DUF488 domain-containing protein [Accumulibacter sp.]
MKVFTIGFTKKNAEQFFMHLRQPGLVKVIDVRLNNTSQLAGFTKREDLSFFLREINGIGYTFHPELAPTREILDEYKKGGGDWSTYEQGFMELMAQRRIEEKISRKDIDGSCLLCSESTPEHCHRRLVAEYLRSQWGKLEIIHL